MKELLDQLTRVSAELTKTADVAETAVPRADLIKANRKIQRLSEAMSVILPTVQTARAALRYQDNFTALRTGAAMEPSKLTAEMDMVVEVILKALKESEG